MISDEEMARRTALDLARRLEPVRRIPRTTAQGPLAARLVKRLSFLLDGLETIAANRVLWKQLASYDEIHGVDSREWIARLGTTPWEEMLGAAGYAEPPPPDREQMAAALRSHLLYTLDVVPGSDSGDWAREVKLAQGRLKSLTRVMRRRLAIEAAKKRSSELPLIAEIALDLSLDAAGALIVAGTAAGAPFLEVPASVAWAASSKGMVAAIENAFGAARGWLEDRRPLPISTVTDDPIAVRLSLLLDNAAAAHTDLCERRENVEVAIVRTQQMRGDFSSLRAAVWTSDLQLDGWQGAETWLERFYSSIDVEEQIDALAHAIGLLRYVFDQRVAQDV